MVGNAISISPRLDGHLLKMNEDVHTEVPQSDHIIGVLSGLRCISSRCGVGSRTIRLACQALVSAIEGHSALAPL